MENIDDFFEMLNNLCDYNLNFSEKQKECNGIFIDIDRYNKMNDRVYDNEKLIEQIITINKDSDYYRN